MKNLISMRDLSKAEITQIMDMTKLIDSGELKPDMRGRLAALLFYEPSTRTHFSFDTAMKRMGGATLTMSQTSSTSVSKGETFADTLKTISMYSDLIVIRTAIEGAARYAAETVENPVINAGDGSNQHPTQALLDLYSIVKTQGTLENLHIGVVGDLRFGRTVHSLVQALSDFSPTFYFASPEHLKMPHYILEDLSEKNIKYNEMDEIEAEISKLDLMYVTRIQRERFADPEEYEKVKDSYSINSAMLGDVKENFRVLHPLPRVKEIATDVDETKYAYYFQQAKNGVYVRQALINILLGGER
jgi:aspartate carbamoyltransferase catalytic subunit